MGLTDHFDQGVHQVPDDGCQLRKKNGASDDDENRDDHGSPLVHQKMGSRSTMTALICGTCMPFTTKANRCLRSWRVMLSGTVNLPFS